MNMDLDCDKSLGEYIPNILMRKLTTSNIMDFLTKKGDVKESDIYKMYIYFSLCVNYFFFCDDKEIYEYRYQSDTGLWMEEIYDKRSKYREIIYEKQVNLFLNILRLFTTFLSKTNNYDIELINSRYELISSALTRNITEKVYNKIEQICKDLFDKQKLDKLSYYEQELHELMKHRFDLLINSDRSHFLIFSPKKAINLLDGRVITFDREDYISEHTPKCYFDISEYNVDIKETLFYSYLLFLTDNDQSLIDVLQLMAGSILYNNHDNKYCWFICGSGNRSKNILLDILARLTTQMKICNPEVFICDSYVDLKRLRIDRHTTGIFIDHLFKSAYISTGFFLNVVYRDYDKDIATNVIISSDDIPIFSKHQDKKIFDLFVKISLPDDSSNSIKVFSVDSGRERDILLKEQVPISNNQIAGSDKEMSVVTKWAIEGARKLNNKDYTADLIKKYRIKYLR